MVYEGLTCPRNYHVQPEGAKNEKLRWNHANPIWGLQNLWDPGSQDPRANWGKSRENCGSRAAKKWQGFLGKVGKKFRKSWQNSWWKSGREKVTRFFFLGKLGEKSGNIGENWGNFLGSREISRLDTRGFYKYCNPGLSLIIPKFIDWAHCEQRFEGQKTENCSQDQFVLQCAAHWIIAVNDDGESS